MRGTARHFVLLGLLASLFAIPGCGADKIPTYFWDPDLDRDAKVQQYHERFELYSEMPPLVG